MIEAIRKRLQQYFQPSQEKYHLSLEDCFELANSEVYTRSQGFLQNRAHEFFRVKDRIQRLSDFLDSLAGIKRFSYVGCGDNAVVVQYDDSQVLRLRAPAIEDQINTHNVPSAPMICPVWKEVVFEGARLNFVPYIYSLANHLSQRNIPRSKAEKYVYALMKGCLANDPQLWFYDYRNYDFKFEQIGILSCGAPVLLDLGAVIHANDAKAGEKDKLLNDMGIVADLKLEFSDWDGRWRDSNGRPYIDTLVRAPKAVLELPEKLA